MLRVLNDLNATNRDRITVAKDLLYMGGFGPIDKKEIDGPNSNSIGMCSYIITSKCLGVRISAVWGREPRLNRDRHQFRVPKKTLEEMVEILKDPEIVEEIKRCECFDDIFTIVYESRMDNFGSLAVYDTSLILGAVFGHYPTVVYLHQGALEGAKELLGKDVVEKTLNTSARTQTSHISPKISFQNL